MVAIVGLAVGVAGLICGSVNAATEGDVFFSGLFLEWGLKGGDLGGELFALLLEAGEFLHGGIVGVVIHVGAINGGKDGLERVVVLLGDGVELVIVALGATDGERTEAADGVLHHVIAIKVAGDLAIEFGLGNFGVADVIPWASGDEAERGDAIGGAGIEHIACDLFFDEA